MDKDLDKQTNDDENKPAQDIGSFAAFLRRPIPQKKGYMAQFFGENGEHADTITALSLTRYMDMVVEVCVFIIKDKDGRMMKANDEYPMIARFIASIHRPKSSISGMVAQLFAENGIDADTVVELGKTDLQDALVYINIKEPNDLQKERNEYDQGNKKRNINKILNINENQKPAQPISIKQVAGQDDLDKLSRSPGLHEKSRYEKEHKRITQANKELIISGFFKNKAVLSSLGREEDFNEWLTTQPCCFPEENSQCDGKPVYACYITPDFPRKFESIPLCEHHKELVENKNTGLPQNGKPHFTTRQIGLVQQWCREVILRKIGLTPEENIIPEKLVALGKELGFENQIPRAYFGYLT